MKRALAMAVLFSGCVVTSDKGGKDTADTGETTPPTTDTDTVDTDDTDIPDPDGDEDGFPLSLDCDDTDPAINPDAVEGCDGIDNNCAGGIDDEFAATVNDASFATLDEAVAVAGGSDTISICPGDWTITGVTRNDDMTFVGVAGRDLTSLMEAQAGTVFTFTDAATLTIEGIDVTGSVSDGIILTDTATLIMTDSRVSAHQGAGIAGDGPVTITLTGTDVEDNISTGDGGGIAANLGANVTLTDSNVRRNEAVEGGGIYAASTFIVGTITLTNTTISENTAEMGGGISSRLDPIVGDGLSFVSGNTALGDGGGIAMYDAPVSGVSITGNLATRGGGVAVLRDPGLDGAPNTSGLVGVVLDSNTGDLGGAIYIGNGSLGNAETLTIDATSVVTLNTATTSGGGAQLTGANANLESDGADWGTDGVDDNTPEDVNTTVGGSTFEGPATFACNGVTGCI